MKNFISKYGKYIIILLVGLLLGVAAIYIYEKVHEGFESGDFGNVAKEFVFANTDSKRLSSVLKTPEDSTEKYILNFDDYINITGFKVELFDEYATEIVQYRLKVESDTINEYVSSGEDIVFNAGKYYDIRESNYNINQMSIFVDATSDISELDKIGRIKIYGIKHFAKLVDDDITIVKNYDTQQFNIQFNKLLDVDNIEYYFVLIAKYDNNKEFISKQIIRLNNNKINFYGQLAKLIPNEYIDFSTSSSIQTTSITTPEVDGTFTLTDMIGVKTTTTQPLVETTTTQPIESFSSDLKISDKTSLSDAANILAKYDTTSLLDVFKLILKNKFLDNGLGDNKETFMRKWNQNYYYYQSDEVKELLKYVYDLIENYADACTEFSCLVSSPKLDVVDAYDNPYYYKVGIGYIRLDVLGNEIYSPITSYRHDGEVLFTMKKEAIKISEANELTTGDNLYNKLKMVNNVDVKKIRGIIGSNYPNNFSISTQNLKDYVELDEYKDNKYSPIQFDINIIDKTTTTQAL